MNEETFNIIFGILVTIAVLSSRLLHETLGAIKNRILNGLSYKIWKIFREHRYRDDKRRGGYPVDWQFRRRATFERFEGRCQSCNRFIRRLRLWYQRHRYYNKGYILAASCTNASMRVAGTRF